MANKPFYLIFTFFLYFLHSIVFPFGNLYNPVFDSLQDRETLYSPYFIGCTAYFPLVLLFGNLLPSLTLFLDFFHFLFRDKLIVRPKAAYLMQRICDPFPLI